MKPHPLLVQRPPILVIWGTYWKETAHVPVMIMGHGQAVFQSAFVSTALYVNHSLTSVNMSGSSGMKTLLVEKKNFLHKQII